MAFLNIKGRSVIALLFYQFKRKKQTPPMCEAKLSIVAGSFSCYNDKRSISTPIFTLQWRQSRATGVLPITTSHTILGIMGCVTKGTLLKKNQTDDW